MIKLFCNQINALYLIKSVSLYLKLIGSLILVFIFYLLNKTKITFAIALKTNICFNEYEFNH